MLAIRDEDPSRPWDEPGEWWRDRPGVVGVRDRRAGGAWLAASAESARLAVLVNRADNLSHGLPAASGLRSRGSLALDAVGGVLPVSSPRTAGFNLVSVAGSSVSVTSWDGERLGQEDLAPGIHMIAHHGVDDPRSARIETWLDNFRALEGAGDDWRDHWISLLAHTAELPTDDDRAIIRDNRTHGYNTLSLLACIAEVRGGTVGSGASETRLYLESATLATPAVWGSPVFRSV